VALLILSWHRKLSSHLNSNIKHQLTKEIRKAIEIISHEGVYTLDYLKLIGVPALSRLTSPLGVRADSSCHLTGFLHSGPESHAGWEGLPEDLHRRGLVERNLKLIITNGYERLAAVMQTVYPRVPHQRCLVHKIRNILEHVRDRCGKLAGGGENTCSILVV
jgi:transposase-like protein